MRTPLVRQAPWIIAAGLAAAYGLTRPPSADLAAQLFRTELFQRVGFTVWNGQWFAGHHVPGYSVLFPPAAALVGPRMVGALSSVASALLFERLAHERFGARAWVGAIWFGAATATNLLTGRLTFALGVTLGLGALLAHQRRRSLTAIVLAVLCPWGSPVAGLFLALAGLAHAVASRRRDALWLAGAALTSTAALQLLFVENGVEPFVFSAFWPTIAFSAAVLALVPRDERSLRVGAVLYAAGCVGAFLLATPMGGNAVRLGALFGGPVLALALWQRRPLALAAAALPVLYWQWSAPVRDVSSALHDPAVRTAYYGPLNRFLSSRGAEDTRVEIPLTRDHWENVFVGLRFPLARGWERQLDVKYNRVLYRSRLGASPYRAWLERTGVAYVALPDAPLDYSAVGEAQLIRRGVAYLEPVWRSRHWRVYRVRGARSLVSGPGRLVSIGPDWFALRATRAARLLVRTRFTPYWSVTAGSACLAPTGDGLTGVTVRRPGYVRVVARFTPARLLGRAGRCRAVA
jgi:hypothetical protein